MSEKKDSPDFQGLDEGATLVNAPLFKKDGTPFIIPNSTSNQSRATFAELLNQSQEQAANNPIQDPQVVLADVIRQQEEAKNYSPKNEEYLEDRRKREIRKVNSDRIKEQIKNNLGKVRPKSEDQGPITTEFGEKSKVATKSTKTRERTAEAKKAEAEMQNQVEAEITAKQQEVDSIKAEIADNFNINMSRLEIMNDMKNARDKVENAAKLDLDARLKTLKTETDKLASEKYEGFWHDKSLGQKVSSAIALFLGGMAQGIGKLKSNPALEIINQAKAQDFAAFKERQQRKIKAIEESRLGINEKRKALEFEMNKLDAREIAYGKIIDQQLKTIALKFQGEQAQAKALQFSAQLRGQMAEKIANIAEKYKTESEQQEKIEYQMIRIGPDGKPVVSKFVDDNGKEMSDQQKARMGFLEGINHTLARIEELATSDPRILKESAEMVRLLEGLELAEDTKLPFIGGIMGAISKGSGSEGFIRSQFSKEAQEFSDRFATFIGAKLRNESGAAISVGEYIKEFRKFAVREGDKDTFVPKMEELRNYLETVRTSTGKELNNPLYFELDYEPRWEKRRVKK